MASMVFSASGLAGGLEDYPLAPSDDIQAVAVGGGLRTAIVRGQMWDPFYVGLLSPCIYVFGVEVDLDMISFHFFCKTTSLAGGLYYFHI